MYDLTSAPNLKPFRQYDEHDVINFFAHAEGDVNKGTFVSISGTVDPDDHAQEWSSASLGNTPARATSLRPVVPWKLKTAAEHEKVLGMTLYDIREFNVHGERYIFQPAWDTAENQVVRSGEAVPVLTRGIVETNSFIGTPGANSGAAIISGTASGMAVVTNGVATSGRVGTFLSSAGDDGYALLKIEL
jgi:hypothetical protein